MDLEESECLAICLERYMPTALCVLAGSYLPKWPRFRPAPDNEWIPTKSYCRGAVVRTTTDGVFYVGAADRKGPDHNATDVVSVRRGSRIVRLPTRVYWRATDGHRIWGFMCPGQDIVIAKLEEENDKGLVLKNLIGVRPSIADSFLDACFRDVFYDHVRQELVVLYRSQISDKNPALARIGYEWCRPATLASICQKSFDVQWGPQTQTTHCACAGWLFRVASQERERVSPGGTVSAVLSALAPNGAEMQQLQIVHDVRTVGDLVPIDDATVLWLLPCDGGSYTSADGRVASVSTAIKSNNDLFSLCADFARPLTADFHFRGFRLHIPPADASIRVEDRGIVRIPIVQSSTGQPLLWNALLPIICADRHQPVGFAADLVADISSYACSVVPFV
jgi:hypothetical protein